MTVADLAYSLDLLRTLGRELTGLADAMNDTGHAAWEREDIGHPTVADALEDFADAWDDKRERLTGSLTSVGTMATDAAATFQDVDDQLAAEIIAILEPQ